MALLFPQEYSLMSKELKSPCRKEFFCPYPPGERKLWSLTASVRNSHRQIMTIKKSAIKRREKAIWNHKNFRPQKFSPQEWQ